MSQRAGHTENHLETYAGHGTAPGYMQRKDDYARRMKRIEGQVKGIARMIEDEKYCIDILTQVSAVTKALQAVSLGLLDEHMSHCVMDAAQAGGPEADAKLKEASEAIARLVAITNQRRHPCATTPRPPSSPSPA